VRINPQALRTIRRDRDVRLVDLARAVQCTPSHLTNVEAGRREASARLIRALAAELRVPLLSLLGPEVRPDEAGEAVDTPAGTLDPRTPCHGS
jgi:transcriptional regulator with XRE-family HTH domain